MAVANLWDVTDRDIDRFSQGVLSRWLGEGAELLLTEQHSPAQHSVCVGWSVASSRGACRLSNLIGAAPVCYGIPVAVNLPKASEGLQP